MSGINAVGFTVKTEGLLKGKQQMRIMAMPPKIRKKILKYAAYRVVRDSRRRVKKRIDLDGRPFSSHPGGWQNQHLIDLMAKFLAVESVTGLNAIIGWKKAYWSDVSRRIQYGSSERVDDTKRGQLTKFSSKEAPLTKYQARALHAAGFRKTKKNGKLGSKASMSWMRGQPTADGKYRKNFNVTAYKASVILHSMRKRGFKMSRKEGGYGKGDQIRIRGRSFLGATSGETKKYIQEIMQKMTQEITHVAR